MIIIWRSWGWLVLPFFLLVWSLADGPVAALYRTISGDEALYNPEKGVCWAIAFVVVSLPLAALGLWRKHAERTRTPEETAVDDAKRRAELVKYGKSLQDSGVTPAPQVQAVLDGTAPLEPVVRTKSSFFFIPFWLFGFVFAALGLLVLALNLPAALELA